MKRVGFNLLYIVPGRVGGTEIYAHELVRAVAGEHPETEFVAFCGSEASSSLAKAGWPGNVRVRPVRLPSAVKPLRILVELLWLPLLARRERVDLLHSLGTTAPFWSRCARVVTVHDLIYHHWPQTFPRLARAGLEFVVPRSARRAHRVQADSQATKDDLATTYGIDPSKVDVVYLGLGMATPEAITPEAELRDRLQLDDRPVVLSVAAALVHKNVDGLLRAFAELTHGDAPDEGPLLVIPGHSGREQERLVELAGALGVGERVRFTGWIEAPDLEGLYRLATCFVYPSKHEGFGLPVLEAMHRGTPVASSFATSLSEVAGNAAELFDPGDTTAITAAMRRLLEDRAYAAELVERGHTQAARFTWQRAAQTAWASYALAVEGRHTGRRVARP